MGRGRGQDPQVGTSGTQGVSMPSYHRPRGQLASSCARDRLDTVHCVVHCRVLFMGTVHEHYSWALLKKKEKKEKKNDPWDLGRHMFIEWMSLI